MKVLLDECLPVDFRHSFPGHEAHSVEWAGLKGKTNGELPQAAEGKGYQVLLRVDQGIPPSADHGGPKTRNHFDRSRTNQRKDLLPLAPAIIEALEVVL